MLEIRILISLSVFYPSFGQAGISDHFLLIFIVHIIILAINKMRWSSRSGEAGQSQRFFHHVH